MRDKPGYAALRKGLGAGLINNEPLHGFFAASPPANALLRIS